MNPRPAVNVRLAVVAGGLIFSTCLAASPLSAEPAKAPEKSLTIEGITEYRLDNGFGLLLFPDPSTATVTVNLTVLVGSRHEGYGETGMAHLLEHMLFKGTTTRKDIPKSLKERGAEYNASTWIDRTNYFETMTGTDDNLRFALELEADRLVNSLVRREDLLSEMTVVRSEFEQGENSPRAILSQRITSAAFEWHNYGKSTIGNRSDIERVPINRLQAFYHKYYRPDNCVLVIAGKFNEALALKLVAETFGKLKRPGQPLENTYTEEPAQDGERNVILRRVGKVAFVGALYHIPAAAHEDYAAIEVLNRVLVNEPAGRLYKALVDTHKAASVSGTAMGCHDPGVLEFTAEVDPGTTPEANRDVMLEVVEGIGGHPVRTDEVERAKHELATQRELLMTRSSAIGRILSEFTAMGDWRLFFWNRDQIAKVTAADVNRVASKYLVRNNRTAGMYIPTEAAERVAIPATPAIEGLLKDYRGSQTIAAGEAFEPTPENIEKRVERITLSGGIKLALLPKKSRGEAVVGVMALHYGSESSLKDHTSATQFIASLMERGTKKHSRQEIKDELDRLGSRVGASGSLGDASFSFQTKKANVVGFLRLLAEMLREPTFPASELEVIKRGQRAQLQAGLTDPRQLAIREMQRRINPYPADDVRYVPTIQESISRLNAVNVDEIRKVYEEQWGAGAVELALVGDFDPQAVRTLVQELFGDWKSKIAYQRIGRPAKTEVAGGRQSILTPDKENAIYIAAEMLAMTDVDPDYPALEIANLLLGGGSLSSRLGNRVRQKEGLSYTVGSQFSAATKDRSARFIVFAICNPKNMEKLDRTIAEEISKLVEKGVDDKELAEAKQAYREQEKLRLARDATVAGTLAEELSNDRTFAYYADLEKKVADLTPAQVNEALKKHLTPSRLVIVEAGDFKKQTSRLP